MTAAEIIIVQLEQAFRQKSWHGPNLLGSIRGIDIETAAWRPAKGRHNIWEIIVHAAYWKYSVYRRFAGETKSSFPIKGSNWFERPMAADETELRADVLILKNYHSKLVEDIRNFPNRNLKNMPEGSSTPYLDLALRAAAHDLYHAGQIQLIKRLYRS